METSEKSEETCVHDPTDLEDILGRLDALHKDMSRLALQTELRRCDLIVCFGRPDKTAPLKRANAGQIEPGPAPAPEE